MNSFWNFNPWDKHDTIGRKHLHLLVGALRDPQTGVVQNDKDTFILYGEEEALLLYTKSKIIKWSLYLYMAFLGLGQ